MSHKSSIDIIDEIMSSKGGIPQNWKDLIKSINYTFIE